VSLLSPTVPTQKTVQVSVTVIGLAAVIALLYFGQGFFVTLIISAMFAFILDPVVELVMKAHVPRPASAAVVIVAALTGVYALAVLAWHQAENLSADLPTYASRINELYDKASDRLESFEKSTVNTVVPKKLREQEEQIQQKPQEALKARRRKAGLPMEAPSPTIQEVKVHTEPKPAISVIYGVVSKYFHSLLQLSFVPFLVYFMLSWSEHVRKSILQMFRGEERYMVGKSLGGVADLTRAYILGNFILGLFLSVASALAFFLFQVPYWALIGPISGFFSLAPYVGLPLAVIPPVMAALAVPNKFTTILSVVLVTSGLHLVALNFLYPKVVGKRVHLNPLVVTVALMFWSALWGGIGLLLAIPITAAIKGICDNVDSLRPYGKLLGD
jgi:predicted PurR-regulated permease PerM